MLCAEYSSVLGPSGAHLSSGLLQTLQRVWEASWFVDACPGQACLEQTRSLSARASGCTLELWQSGLANPQVQDPTDAALLPPPFSEADTPTPVPLAALRDLNPRGFAPGPRSTLAAPAAATSVDDGRAARRRPAPQGPTQARPRAVRAGQRASSEDLSAAIVVLRGAGFHRNLAWALNPAGSVSAPDHGAQQPAARGVVVGGAACTAGYAEAGSAGDAGSTATGPAGDTARPAAGAGAAADSGSALPRGTAAVQEILERLEVDERGDQRMDQERSRSARPVATE